jgi:alpha-beta hydrolase superfamily lysophospholipase
MSNNERDTFMRWIKNKGFKTIIIFIITILIYLFGFPNLSQYLQSKFLSTPPNGFETPETYGISYERVKIKSDNRFLDSYIVIAPSAKQMRDVVLIFHGAGETISCWAKVQKNLYDNGISSLVFDYSGFGNSSHPGSIKNLNKDALAVYLYSVSKFKNSRLYVLGFSLGNAPMLASINDFKPAPSGVIVGSAFSSLKELGKYSGKANSLFKILANVIPDV